MVVCDGSVGQSEGIAREPVNQRQAHVKLKRIPAICNSHESSLCKVYSADKKQNFLGCFIGRDIMHFV